MPTNPNPYQNMYDDELKKTIAQNEQPDVPVQIGSFLSNIGQGAKDLAVGAAKGAYGTLTSGDEWARGHLPAFMTNSSFGFGPPADLDKEKQRTQTRTPMQNVGKVAENIAEFAVPGGAEERLAAKGAELLPVLGKATRPALKALGSTLSSGVINKAQGGDFTTGAALGLGGNLLGQGMKAAAPFSREAGKFLTATPEAQKLATTRFLVPGTSLQALSKAINPFPTEREDFVNSFNRVFHDIAESNPSSVEDVARLSRSGQRGALRDFAQIASPYKNVPVDTSLVQKAQENSVNLLDRIENPMIDEKTREAASRYVPGPGEVPHTIGSTGTLVKQLNQKLRPFYNLAKGDKYAAQADPQVRRLESAANSLRNIQYGGLSELSGIPEEEIRSTYGKYGDYKNIGDVAERQKLQMMTSADPESLHNLYGLQPKRAALHTLTQRIMGDANNPDALVRSAVDRFTNPESTPLPVGGQGKKLLRGATNAASWIMGARPTAPLATGGLLQYNRDNKNKEQ